MKSVIQAVSSEIIQTTWIAIKINKNIASKLARKKIDKKKMASKKSAEEEKKFSLSWI